ncbi:MAG: lipopolysaccharide assembly protein LapA domain-containing protein [Tropicimonas sp.]|uniref:lipopolysaccharide assembly protein LapA domain-containing protein n=1 Tax=Tropicimonas sp. TaxID=2067044 RepID=UPI003A8533B1
MRYIRYLLLGLIVAGLVVVAMANREVVTVTVLPGALERLVNWNYAISLPLFIVVFGGVAVGLLIGYLFEWLREHKHRVEATKRQKQVKTLNREVTRLKTDTAQGKDDVLAILDEAVARKAS